MVGWLVGWLGRKKEEVLGEKLSSRGTKAPLQWRGVVFALATNLLLPTVMEGVLGVWPLGIWLWVASSVVAPLLAGILTARYVGQRGAIHAFLGGLLSLPLLGQFVFGGNWQLALFAFAFCALGGALTEVVLRRQPYAS